MVAGAGSSDEFSLTCAGDGAPFVKLAVSEGRGANAYPFETQALEVVAALPPLDACGTDPLVFDVDNCARNSVYYKNLPLYSRSLSGMYAQRGITPRPSQ